MTAVAIAAIAVPIILEMIKNQKKGDDDALAQRLAPLGAPPNVPSQISNPALTGFTGLEQTARPTPIPQPPPAPALAPAAQPALAPPGLQAGTPTNPSQSPELLGLLQSILGGVRPSTLPLAPQGIQQGGQVFTPGNLPGLFPRV